MRYLPIRNIERSRRVVVELEVLRQNTRRVVHDFADDNLFGMRGNAGRQQQANKSHGRAHDLLYPYRIRAIRPSLESWDPCLNLTLSQTVSQSFVERPEGALP